MKIVFSQSKKIERLVAYLDCYFGLVILVFSLLAVAIITPQLFTFLGAHVSNWFILQLTDFLFAGAIIWFFIRAAFFVGSLYPKTGDNKQ